MSFRLKARGTVMDDRYYYRTLGITSENPTQQQIKKAYEQRIAKLKSADYGDDREYANKKMREAAEAYRRLTGQAPSSSDKSGQAKGMSSGLKEKAKEYKKELLAEAGKFKKDRGKPPMAVFIAVIAAVVIAGGVISGVSEVISDNHYSNTSYVDFSFDENGEAEEDAIDEMAVLCSNTDYYSGVDFSDADDYYYGLVDWEQGVGEYGDERIFNGICGILEQFGINNITGFFAYITGESEFYSESDDYDCASALIEWMQAPYFEMMAGARDMYNERPILSISEYLNYLERRIAESYDVYYG